MKRIFCKPRCLGVALWIIFSPVQTFFLPDSVAYANSFTGLSFSLSGDFVLVAGGTLNNKGTLVMMGNLVNNGTADLGTGVVKMSGTTTQSISGTNVFQGLEINNPAGVTLGGNISVNGTLTLTNGLVNAGANNFTLGPSASISGTPGSGKMIAVSGTGQLLKAFPGPGSFTFPVGDNTGTPEYSPVTLTFSSGSFPPSNWVAVNLVNSPYPGSSGSYLKRYWNLSSSGISNFACSVIFNYVPADVVGNESNIYCVRVNPLPSVIYDSTNLLLHQLNATNLSSFGTFTGKPGNRSLNLLSVMLEGLYNGSGLMRKADDESGAHFGGDTADVIKIELHKSTDYSQIKYTASNVGLSVSGTAGINIPGRYNESYYLTIKHRNSIETTTAVPVLLKESPVSYSFDTPGKAYDSNMGLTIDGAAVIYSGDPNQDGLVDGSDLSDLGNLATQTATGYIPGDLTGDGLVDGDDLSLAGNNAAIPVSARTP